MSSFGKTVFVGWYELFSSDSWLMLVDKEIAETSAIIDAQTGNIYSMMKCYLACFSGFAAYITYILPKSETIPVYAVIGCFSAFFSFLAVWFFTSSIGNKLSRIYVNINYKSKLRYDRAIAMSHNEECVVVRHTYGNVVVPGYIKIAPYVFASINYMVLCSLLCIFASRYSSNGQNVWHTMMLAMVLLIFYPNVCSVFWRQMKASTDAISIKHRNSIVDLLKARNRKRRKTYKSRFALGLMVIVGVMYIIEVFYFELPFGVQSCVVKFSTLSIFLVTRVWYEYYNNGSDLFLGFRKHLSRWKRRKKLHAAL